MSGKSTLSVLQHLHRLAREQKANTHSDRECLERFVIQHDEDAFAVLVRRHGPMVLSVCRRLLRDSHDIEDAFQAAFLTLVRKGQSIRRPQALAGWLYRVAYRIALRLRREAAERARREKPGVETVLSVETDILGERDLRVVLDEAIDALPERYRQVLVLCCLEGKTHAEAARLLGRPTGTISCWLKRGRERLCTRLARRGFAPAAAFSILGENEATAPLSAPLVRSTCLAAILFTAGRDGAAAVISARVAALVDAVVPGMAATKLQWTVLLGVTLGMTAGAGMVYQLSPAQRPGANQETKTETSKQPQQQEKQATRVDLYGDSLPEGAIARMGSLRLRHAGLSDFVFLRAGEILVSAGGSVLRFWDMPTGKRVRQVRLQDAIGSWQVALSPNGQTVAALTQKSLCFWQIVSGKQIQKIAGQPENAAFLHFSPDGRLLAVGTWDGKVSLWEWEKKKERLLEVPPRKFGIDSAFHSCFSPDGKWFVTGGGWDSPLGVYESATGREVRRVDCSASVSTISADSKRLAVASMKNDKGVAETVLRFFELESGKQTVQYPLGHRDSYFSLAFCPDAKHLACGRSYRSCLLDHASGRVVHRLSGFPQKLMFAPDGKTLSAIAGARIRMWNVATGRDREDGMGHFERALSISPDGRILAAAESGEPAVSLWDSATGRFLRALPAKEGGHTVKSLEFVSGGKSLFAGQSSGTLRFWDVADGKEQRIVQFRDENRPTPHNIFFHQCHVSEDGKRVSTLEWFGARNESTRLALWDMDSGKLLSQHVMLPSVVPTYSVLETAWSADAATLTLRRNDGLTQMRVQSGAIHFRIPNAANIHALVASPDGRLLAAARDAKGEDKDTVGIWEAATGKEIANVAIGPVSRLALAPDDQHLFVTDEKCLRLWDLATGKERRRWPLPEVNTAPGGNSVVTRLMLSPDGRRVFTALNDGTALVWDLQPALPSEKSWIGKLRDKELEYCWADLAADDARRAYAAIWRLSETPEAAMSFLRRRVKPVTDSDVKAVRRLLADLESEVFDTREQASEQLAKLGPTAEPILRQGLEQKPTLEARRRMQLLLEKIDGQPASGEALRLLRTLQVLENAGEEGRRLLRELANGAEGAWLTRAAKATLARSNRGRR